jgi:hypothetical protein
MNCWSGLQLHGNHETKGLGGIAEKEIVRPVRLKGVPDGLDDFLEALAAVVIASGFQFFLKDEFRHEIVPPGKNNGFFLIPNRKQDTVIRRKHYTNTRHSASKGGSEDRLVGLQAD